MDDESFDIYGDLDAPLLEPLQEEKIRQEKAELQKEEDEKRAQNEFTENVAKIKNENSQMKKNFSLLLATARREIER